MGIRETEAEEKRYKERKREGGKERKGNGNWLSDGVHLTTKYEIEWEVKPEWFWPFYPLRYKNIPSRPLLLFLSLPPLLPVHIHLLFKGFVLCIIM